MSLIVIAQAESADALARGDRLNRAVAEILRVVERSGAHIAAQFPDVNDAELRRYFVVDAADASRAEAIADDLRRCQAVEAAYWKPPDELPS